MITAATATGARSSAVLANGSGSIDDFVPYLLTRVDYLISEPFHQHLRSLGFTVAEWRILATLVERQEVTISHLAELVLLPQPTVSRWIERLEAEGTVARSDDSVDRRRTFVSITPAGERIAKDLMNRARLREAEVMEILGEDGSAELRSTLQHLVTTLEEHKPPNNDRHYDTDNDNETTMTDDLAGSLEQGQK